MAHNHPLATLFAEHTGKVSDKWTIYITEYERLFGPYADQPISLLEIGIQNGGSLEIWAKYFNTAEKLIGCDINPDCAQLQFDDERIALVVANANTDVAQQQIYNLSPVFDIIIDDGSHHSGDIVASFARYFPSLNEGGIFIAEDLHCSYWQDYQGGLYQPYSSIAFFKQLADIVNFEHWGVSKSRTEVLDIFNQQYGTQFDEVALAYIHSIEFINSICVIRKEKPKYNILGRRFVAGSQALVVAEVLGLHGSNTPEPNQSDNAWSTKSHPIEELEGLRHRVDMANIALVARDSQIEDLASRLREREQTLSIALLDVQQRLESKTHDLTNQEINHLNETQSILRAHLQQISELNQDHQALIQNFQHQKLEHEWLSAERISALNEELHAIRTDYAEREKAHSHSLDVLHNENLALIESQTELAEAQKAELVEQHQSALVEIQRRHAEHEWLTAEQIHHLNQTLHQLHAAHSAREQEFSQQLHALQQNAENEKTQSLRQYQSEIEALQAQLAEHQWLAHERIQQLNDEVRLLLADALRREQVHAEQVNALSLLFSEREQKLHDQLNDASLQLRMTLSGLAEREKAFAEQVRLMQDTHDQANHDVRHEFTEQKHALQAQLKARLDIQDQKTRDWMQAEQAYTQIINQLQSQLHVLHDSVSWRYTAPLRYVAQLWSKPGLNEEKLQVNPMPSAHQGLPQSQPVADIPIPMNEAPLVQSETPKAIRHEKGMLSSAPVNPVQAIGMFDMSSSQNPRIASSVDELLSYHDAEFVHCAYQTLLGRAPDAEGLRYYLARVRSGVSKVEILTQLRLGTEGRSRPVIVSGLDKTIKRHKLLKTPLLGALLQIAGVRHPEANILQSLRILDNKIYALNINLLGNLAQINNNLKQLMVKPTQNSNEPKLPEQELIDLESPIEFDADWYLEQNPDVAASGVNPLEHYLLYGKKEHRYPFFDSEWYLSQYPDVEKSGMDPREHFIKHGKEEGRFPAFDGNWYLKRYPDVAASKIDPISHYLQHGKAEGRLPGYSLFNLDRNDYHKWVNDFDTITDKVRAAMQMSSDKFENKPLISVVMPVYNPNPIWLVEAIESVRNQIYPNWELCIADDLSPDKSIRPILERYVKEDKRIKVVFRTKNGHISNATNSALEVAEGEWIALLDHDDLLSEHALFCVVDVINKKPDARMIYSDEDKINEQGVRSAPYFKCDWNLDLFYSHNMFSHLGVYHTELIRKVGGFRVGMEGSQDYDLALRCIEHIKPVQIHHIPRVLYHWRVHAESTASSSDAKPYAMIAGERAINEHFKRQNINAKAELIIYGYRVRYALPDVLPLVSLIIPTRNGLVLLKQCIESILIKTTYTNYEIIIVDNGSDEPDTLRYLEILSKEKSIRVMRDENPFNYSALNNAAVKLARGEIIGLINNDIEVISPEWLSEMVSHALRSEIGAVGAKLFYPDDTIQHAGVLLGVNGLAAHAHKKLPRKEHGYFGRANLIQSFSAVTAACLVIRKSVYESVGGLNEVDLKIAFNDVDLCVRLLKSGFRNIWTPYSELYHHESATRGYDDDTLEKGGRFAKEVDFMSQHSLGIPDPAYSPNLTLIHEDFSLAWPPRVKLLSEFSHA